VRPIGQAPRVARLPAARGRPAELLGLHHRSSIAMVRIPYATPWPRQGCPAPGPNCDGAGV
jgi:hypothetical protein